MFLLISIFTPVPVPIFGLTLNFLRSFPVSVINIFAVLSRTLSYPPIIMCFASDEAAKYVQGKSWVAEAARVFDVEIHVVQLPEDQKNNVLSAQKRQRMVNPS